MSEKTDKEDKTEEATQKKIDDNLEEGNVPISKDASIVALTLALILYVNIIAPLMLGRGVNDLSIFINLAHDISLKSQGDISALSHMSSYILAYFVIPLSLVVLISSVISLAIQIRLGFHLNKIAPKVSNISPLNGFKRLTSSQNLIEWLKSGAKLIGATVIVGQVSYRILDQVLASTQIELEGLPGLMATILFTLLLWLLCFQILLFGLDLFHTRHVWSAGLRMSRHEVKEEMRQIEGNHQVKSRLRAISANRSRMRMMADLPKATVVVVNPTHYSVALRYNADQDDAPLVLAKGIDSLAWRIRQIAELHNVPIVEDRILARTLYAQVEIQKSIPSELYRAVAQLLVFLNARTQAAPTYPD